MHLPSISSPEPTTQQQAEINRRTAAVLRQLMKSRKITARALQKSLGIHYVTISRTLNKKTRLSPQNFTKLRDALCENPHERRLFDRAYTDPYWEVLMEGDIPTEKPAQVEYLTAKVNSALKADEACLRRAVRKVLKASKLDYDEDYVIGDAVLDFVITYSVEMHDGTIGFAVPVERQCGITLHSTDAATFNPMLPRHLRDGTLVDELLIIHPNEHTTTASQAECFGEWLPLSELQLYLTELKADSCPPPLSEEDVAFKSQVRARLMTTKLPLTTKKYTDCIVRPDQLLIALHYARELKYGIAQEFEEALEIQKALKCKSVLIVIPDELGIRNVIMHNGIRMLALSELKSENMALEAP